MLKMGINYDKIEIIKRKCAYWLIILWDQIIKYSVWSFYGDYEGYVDKFIIRGVIA